MVLRSGIIYGAIFLVFSTLLSLSGRNVPSTGIYDSGFSIFLYQFGINTFGSFMWLQTLRNERVIDPVKIMFTEDSGIALPVSWFLSTGSYTLLLDVPPIVFYYYINKNLDDVFLQMIWGGACIVLGFSLGSAMSIITHNGRWSGRIGSGVYNSLKMIGLIGIFIIFDLTIFFPGYISIFSFAVDYPLNYIFPVLNIGFIAFTLHATIDSLIASFSWSIFYLISSVYLAYFLSKKIMADLFERNMDTGKRMRSNLFRNHYSSIFSLASKDLKIATRDITNLYTFFFPVFFSLPALLEVFVNKKFGTFPPLYTFAAVFVLTSVSVSFYSLQSLIMEGKSFVNMRIWLIPKREIILSKTLSSLIIFMFFAIPIVFVMIGANIGDLPYAAIIIVDAGLAFFFSSLLTLSFMMTRIPEEASSVNIYSFDGIIGLIIIFAISAFSGAFAPIISFTVSAFLVVPGIDFPSIFLGIILILSLILIRLSLSYLSGNDKAKV
ncbi:MAG: hypothetical protein M1496_01810 [Candidatus Thermoplasmatota archaeon]|jgi:hypothetical protein|nr:hypothetical protein [Candidatus Thermoplasmatota archaeon]